MVNESEKETYDGKLMLSKCSTEVSNLVACLVNPTKEIIKVEQWEDILTKEKS